MMWRWLTRFFRREPVPPLMPKPGPLTRATALRQIEALLAHQFADAELKARYSERWGDTGWIVHHAVRDCAAILQPWSDGEAVQAYFQRVLPELAALAERFRASADDPDGYGLGTVREIENSIAAMARVTGELI